MMSLTAGKIGLVFMAAFIAAEGTSSDREMMWVVFFGMAILVAWSSLYGRGQQIMRPEMRESERIIHERINAVEKLANRNEAEIQFLAGRFHGGARRPQHTDTKPLQP